MIYSKTREVGKKEILQGWRRFLKNYKPTPLTPEEELAMDRMMLARKRSQGIKFIPGEEVKEMGASATRQPFFICKKGEMECSPFYLTKDLKRCIINGLGIK